ncbi:MAG: P-II family nitrogen regulator [Nitrincola lacisaponensis]|uniref:Putative nitrogen regulatory protein P-II n=1 Tax=Nitrincola lacisaponensis TaxID=267850 RepID=A0A063Y257_9GAMM|nr:P-II family nitrogen regulator [Nitrincola lacisaponensis]KDE40383.1 putative nitrogen regulatory protein P-II [Nitrincola lacisaponensis]
MQFKLIMAFVDADKTDQVMHAARDAGATGATVINNAQGQGLHKVIGILGFEILNPRAVVLILAESRRADAILEAIAKAGQLDESLSTGIAIQIDVDKALGLKEHIETLEKQLPID